MPSLFLTRLTFEWILPWSFIRNCLKTGYIPNSILIENCAHLYCLYSIWTMLKFTGLIQVFGEKNSGFPFFLKWSQSILIFYAAWSPLSTHHGHFSGADLGGAPTLLFALCARSGGRWICPPRWGNLDRKNDEALYFLKISAGMSDKLRRGRTYETYYLVICLVPPSWNGGSTVVTQRFNVYLIIYAYIYIMPYVEIDTSTWVFRDWWPVLGDSCLVCCGNLWFQKVSERLRHLKRWNGQPVAMAACSACHKSRSIWAEISSPSKVDPGSGRKMRTCDLWSVVVWVTILMTALAALADAGASIRFIRLKMDLCRFQRCLWLTSEPGISVCASPVLLGCGWAVGQHLQFAAQDALCVQKAPTCHATSLHSFGQKYAWPNKSVCIIWCQSRYSWTTTQVLPKPLAKDWSAIKRRLCFLPNTWMIWMEYLFLTFCGPTSKLLQKSLKLTGGWARNSNLSSPQLPPQPSTAHSAAETAPWATYWWSRFRSGWRDWRRQRDFRSKDGVRGSDP